MFGCGLKDGQREWLIYGHDFFGGEGFMDLNEARAAWQRIREELMHEHAGPGRRPYGYFVFELGEEPKHWYEELAALLRHGAIDSTEAAAIERTYRMLSGEQGDFCRSYDDPAQVRRMANDAYIMRTTAERFEFGAVWHRWRGRLALAQVYSRRAEIVRSMVPEDSLECA